MLTMKQPTMFFLALLTAGTLLGHHGSAASYDQKRTLRIEGTVIEFLWRNPHSALFVRGKDESGKELDYSIEMYSPGQMVKLGYTKTVFKPGDHVVLETHPSFSNAAAAECQGCKIVVNGKVPGHP